MCLCGPVSCDRFQLPPCDLLQDKLGKDNGWMDFECSPYCVRCNSRILGALWTFLEMIYSLLSFQTSNTLWHCLSVSFLVYCLNSFPWNSISSCFSPIPLQGRPVTAPALANPISCGVFLCSISGIYRNVEKQVLLRVHYFGMDCSKVTVPVTSLEWLPLHDVYEASDRVYEIR